MFISIIIPNYNGARWLPKTLDSCIVQKQFIKEIIIVDDYSTDDSWNIIQRYKDAYPEIIIAVKNPLKGGNNARNYGFSLSTGAFIQWLDADDQLLPGKFECQLQVFEKNHEVDIVYSDWKLTFYDDCGNAYKEEYKNHQSYDDFLYQILIDNWSPPHAYLIKREMAKKLFIINAWNPDTKVLQDREYFTIAAINSAHFLYLPGCFAVYNRWSRATVSSAKKELKSKQYLQLLCRFEQDINNLAGLSNVALSKYQNIINTQKLLLATEEHLEITVNYGIVKLLNVDWNAVSAGPRTKLRLIFFILKRLRSLNNHESQTRGRI